MNEKQLREILTKWKPPAPKDGAEEKALYHARLALGQQDSEDPIRRPRGFGAASWLLLASGLACLLTLFWIGGGQPETPKVRSAEQEESIVMNEMEQVFQGRLNAVVSKGGSVEVLLAEENQQASDQRIWARLQEGDAIVELLTYSGKSVCVELNGKEVCFEVLMQADGEVLLVGDELYWDSRDATPANGIRVSAGTLKPFGRNT